ncbi:MAG: LPS export ABC transporter periplasmic protein LptC, partial [Armatimonadetes bacterium]|nr:LPS export ABC transporter periplasmic protein LptC [Armatimonadota bacterium]
MRSRRWVLALTGSIVPLLLALVWVETQRSRAEHPAPSSPPAARPAMVLHDHVERVRTRRGEVSWQFQGDRIEVLDSGDYLVYGLKRGQYFSNQVVEVEFTAERARFEARTQNILVRGQVEVSSLRGLRFSADSMAWFEAEGKMYAPTVRQVEWRDPKRPGAPPATLQTGRLFYYPREQRLELPDRLTGSHQGSRIEAAAGSASLDTARLQLAGPAQVAV